MRDTIGSNAACRSPELGKSCRRAGSAHIQMSSCDIIKCGGWMKAKMAASPPADMCVTKSHGQPHLSDDNPSSESHFSRKACVSKQDKRTTLTGIAACQNRFRPGLSHNVPCWYGV
jgi:hypothetical protein